VDLERRLHDAATANGFAGLGFGSADPFPDTNRHLEVAKASGRAATLGFTYSQPAVASDVRVSFPWAVSIVTAAYAYLPDGGDPGPAQSGTGRVARFATRDHYVALRAGLDELAALIHDAGFMAEVLCDDNRLVDRAAAVRSGVAWWGKSTMVLIPGYGPWVLLGSVITDAPLEATDAMSRECGTCDACIPACPTGAIVEPGVLDARRCLAAAAQSKGPIPLELRKPMGDRVYGCDECLAACPPGERLAARSTRGVGRIDLLDLLATADRPLRSRWAHFYVPRNQSRYLRRNAIVALGNGGDQAHVGVLCGLLGHPDPLLRGHAAWALGSIGGPVALAALRVARGSEADVEVHAEIDLAVGTLS
jgi:epoxyqueuosine reductase